MDGTRIGDKPGLEACVVSQVVADSLARLPLEGCRDTRRVHGGLSHCSRPQELSSVFVIHDSATTIHWALKYDPARLFIHPRPLSRSCK